MGQRWVTGLAGGLLVLLVTGGLGSAAAAVPGDPLDPELRSWVEQHGAVRVGWARGIEPVAIWDGDVATGGFGVDVWDLGAVKLGVEVEHVPFDDITSVVEALRDGSIDVAGTHGARPDLLEFAEMAPPNAWERLVLVTTPDRVPVGGEPEPGARVSTVAGSLLVDLLADARPELTYVETTTVPEGIDAVATGELDFYFNGLALLGWYGREAGYDLVPVGDAVATTELGSWATVGTPAAGVSAAVRMAVSDDELALLHNRWTGFDLGDPDRNAELPAWLLPAGAGVLGLVLGLAAFAYVLRRRVAAATHELRLLNESLEDEVLHRTEQLAVSNRALHGFASTAAHDMKNPLVAINGLATILPDLPDDQRREVAGRISRSSRRLLGLVDHLLSAAVEASGASGVAVDGIDLRAWLHDVCGPELEVTQARLTVVIEEEEQLDVDESVLRRAALNFVTNAVKYASAEDGVRIEVTLQPRDGGWLLVVEDDGPGIPGPLRDLVFETGQRLVDDDRGTGLGLAGVAEHVGAAGGHVDLDDSPTLGGARFSAWLPSPEASATRRHLPAGQTAASPASSSTGSADPVT